MKSSEILINYRKNKGLTVSKFAEMLGVSQVFLTHLEHDRRKISDDLFKKMENFLSKKEIEMLKETEKYKDVPEDIINKINLLEKENKALKSNAKILVDETVINIPVLAKASAGNGYINFSNQPLYNKLIRKNGFHEYCYLIEVFGNSMEPLIQDGAYVVVDPYQTDYIEGKIYVIRYRDEVYIKRVILKPEAKLMILKSINPDYEDIYIPTEQSEQVKIIGRAVKFIHEGSL
ncbi:MAG: S24 family peptidase [Fusobacterium sp.]|uniref:LexA family transcriptional regulator n=1 Tax=Fusobacterium sp. TaxID=68766 RepID=UPI002E769F2B|nr:S24 family peptidase [Fusobacterium sp.]MEE1477095.1 S24 family peptidase [Fusobacterium sp.]